ncbi:phosphorylcholine transferase LicD [Enterococcus sp.]|uniref:LicD family protein n=1 Tax=Enterococcus sp. TaxID=35783 RepID=UPI002911ADF9|nr:LicD family protein [Enterococcus sp.]MDU5335234.1 LicD family protein [Enterococcus sp.]
MYSKDKQLRQVQVTSLELAKYFSDFCDRNGLLCYLCGGGAIGSVRHQGFIPWDDDLDFFMPRSDYEKLLVLWKDQESDNKFVLLRASKDYNDRNSFTTLRDKETTFIKTYQEDLDISHGIQIDIFPLDVAPEKKYQRKIQKFWALVYAVYCSQQVPQNHGAFFAKLGKLLLNLAPSQLNKYHVWKYAENRMTKYNSKETGFVTELCVGPRYMGNVYPKKDFSDAKKVPFENTELPIPIGYDNYLSNVFGHYMQLPPEDQRVAHHETVFIDPDNAYTKYKGIYYLTNKEDK